MLVVVCKTLLGTCYSRDGTQVEKAAFLAGGVFLGCCHWNVESYIVFFENSGGEVLIV